MPQTSGGHMLGHRRAPYTWPWLFNKQVLSSLGSSAHRHNSTLVRPAVGGPEFHDGRDAFVISLPELFVMVFDSRVAGDVYEEWLQADIIIGKKLRRGQHGQ